MPLEAALSKYGSIGEETAVISLRIQTKTEDKNNHIQLLTKLDTMKNGGSLKSTFAYGLL
jgi:hypothetical protein